MVFLILIGLWKKVRDWFIRFDIKSRLEVGIVIVEDEFIEEIFLRFYIGFIFFNIVIFFLFFC